MALAIQFIRLVSSSSRPTGVKVNPEPNKLSTLEIIDWNLSSKRIPLLVLKFGLSLTTFFNALPF